MTLKQKHFLNTNFTSDHFIFFDLLSVLIQHMSWWGFRNTVVIYKYTLLQIKKEKNLKWLIISNTYLFNCLTIINNIFFRFFLLNLALCEQSQPNWHFVLWQHVSTYWDTWSTKIFEEGSLQYKWGTLQELISRMDFGYFILGNLF